MVKFVRNIVLFILPLLLLVVGTIPVYFLARGTGEFDSIDVSTKVQRANHNCLVGLGYNEQTPYYKLLNANYSHAPILSIGTSRVMQFKKAFFSSEFYNCGGAVGGNYNEYKNFLENLDYNPETVIVGLDAWVFNDAWNVNCVEYESFQKIAEVERGTIPIMKSILWDWFTNKWKTEDLNLYPGNIGFNGRVKDSGYMYDGSYYSGDLYRDPSSSADFEFADTYNRISKGVSRFEWGDHIDEDTIRQLESLLSYCSDRNIQVIGFLAPFAPSVYDIMNESGKYGYLDEIKPACMGLFDKYGFEFYDYMDGGKLDLTDDCFLDGFHGSEIVYGSIIIDMVNHNSSLEKYVDINHINELLKHAYSGYAFKNPFIRSNLPD